MEKIEKLASLLARVAGVEESESPLATISESVKVLSEEVKDEPNEGWFDYVLKRYSGEPSTLDWITITLADLGVDVAIEKCRKRYKNNEFIRYKKTGLMYEEYEDKDAEIVDGDLEDIDDDTMEKICDEIAAELKRTGEDELFRYADYSDDDIDQISKVCAELGVYSYDPDWMDDDEIDSDLGLAAMSDLVAEYDDLSESLSQLESNLQESKVSPAEMAAVIEEQMGKEKLKAEIESLLNERAFKNAAEFLRNSIKRKIAMKAHKAKMKVGRMRSKMRVTMARALKVATRSVRNAMMMKKAKVSSMAEFRALGVAAKLRVLKWLDQKGIKAKIERKAKQAVAPTMKRLRAAAQGHSEK